MNHNPVKMVHHSEIFVRATHSKNQPTNQPTKTPRLIDIFYGHVNPSCVILCLKVSNISMRLCHSMAWSETMSLLQRGKKRLRMGF